MQFGIVYRPSVIHGYFPFHILVDLPHNSRALKLMDDMQERFGNSYFFQPIMNSNVILLNLYTTSIYELDEIYRKIKGLYKFQHEELFVQKDMTIL